MKIKYLIIVLMVPALWFWTLYRVNAWAEHKPVTPYGDYCPLCTKYGACKTTMSHEDAKKAMIDYYDQKGLDVELERKRGRFIRAKIKDKDQVIDVIIFDRNTGRVRSIY